jgi:ribosomal protein S27E
MELTTRLLFLAAFVAGVSAHPVQDARIDNLVQPMAPAQERGLPAATPMPYRRRAPDNVATTAVDPALGSTPTQACTHTMNITYSRLPTAPYWPQCSFDGTQRIYPSTETVYRSVDCGGCSDLQVNISPIVHCPAKIITAMATMATPTTEYRTVCSATPTPAAADASEQLGQLDLLRARQAGSATCSTTMLVTAGVDGGPTSTVFQRFVTTTSRVSCGGCGLVLVTKIAGQGPVYKPTTTRTTTGTSTVYACAGTLLS